MTTLPELDSDTADTARRLRQAMADQLAGPEDSWRDAFAQVPRHLFVPRFLRQNAQGAWETITAADPGYLEAVYADTALTTQLDGGTPTSSTSQPSLMLSMLHALDVHEGHNVLEVGTGTGYHAALLAHRLGGGHVTTIDVDAELTRMADKRLVQAGYQPAVYTGDGALGVPERGPFDRIIATCGLSALPWPWIEQAATDAVIVVPFGWGLARIAVHESGVEGRFLPGGACFMPRRTERVPPRFADLEHASLQRTDLPVEEVLDRLAFPLSLALPGYSSCTWSNEETGEPEAICIWAPDGSVTRARLDGTVQQVGPRHLWQTVEQLHRLFPEKPAREDFGLTLARDRQRVWFKTPDGPGWDLPHTAFG